MRNQQIFLDPHINPSIENTGYRNEVYLSGGLSKSMTKLNTHISTSREATPQIWTGSRPLGEESREEGALLRRF